MKNDLSIIIPCYNNVSLTKQTVDTLLSTTQSPFTIIFVDDGSTDDTEKYCTELQNNNDNIIYIKNDKNIGVNASWNVGLRKALEIESTYICISNNDVLYTIDWDVHMINELNNGMAVVSPYSTEREVPKDFPQGVGRHVNCNPLEILGCCFMLKASLIDTIGLFPEEIVHYYGDNWIIDICKKNGLKVGHVFDSYVHHLYCKTTGSLPGVLFHKDTMMYSTYKKINNIK